MPIMIFKSNFARRSAIIWVFDPQCLSYLIDKFGLIVCTTVADDISNNSGTCTGVDSCTSAPCQNHGVCITEVNAFFCQCTAFYTGSTCQTGTLISNHMKSKHYFIYFT